MRSCAIMVLNWNGADWLRRCLPSVTSAAARAGAEVWVVDNASEDESEAVCRESFPTVRFFPVGGNLVLAGYNVAAAASDSEILVFLNNDIVVEEGFLAPLLRPFEGDPEVFAVAPRVRSFPPAPDSPIEVEAHSPILDRGLIRGVARSAETLTPTWYTLGGAMACSRTRFLELGGFDEIFFPTYHDDVDLGWRAWKAGWSCWYEPASVVYHAGGATMGRSERVKVMMSRNELLFHWKNLESPGTIAAHALTLLPRLGLRALRDRTALRGFVEATRRLRAVRRSRAATLAHSRLSDGAVLRRFRELERDGAARAD